MRWDLNHESATYILPQRGNPLYAYRLKVVDNRETANFTLATTRQRENQDKKTKLLSRLRKSFATFTKMNCSNGMTSGRIPRAPPLVQDSILSAHGNTAVFENSISRHCGQPEKA